MDNLSQKFNPNIVTKFICFPYSLSFYEFFADFSNDDICDLYSTRHNQKVEEFVRSIDEKVKQQIDRLRLPVMTDIDWRFMAEYTTDGFRVETTQPILKISGVPDDIGKLFLEENTEIADMFKFTPAYESALQTRANHDEYPRNILRDLWYVGNGYVKPDLQVFVAYATGQKLH
ncbi:MAG: hypothetical protein AAF549_09295 [Pseudomonadota bacterium]